MIVINKLYNYLKYELNLSELDYIKLKYSLEAFFSELSKFVILFILFSILGQKLDFLLSFLSLLATRSFIGGLHFNTYSRCIIFSIIFFYISMFLKNCITIEKSTLAMLFIFSIFIVIIFAPIPGNSRPSYSYKKRSQFKLIGVIIISIHFLANLIVHNNPYFINSVWIISLQSIQLLIAKGVYFYEKKKVNP